MTHLWEAPHPYYCTEGNYFSNDYHVEYESWADFAGDDAASYSGDLDLNLLFRWDWNKADPDDYFVEIEEDPDFELPGDTLQLYFMMQRKAACFSVYVGVTEADEDVVREWLRPRVELIKLLWAPLL